MKKLFIVALLALFMASCEHQYGNNEIESLVAVGKATIVNPTTAIVYSSASDSTGRVDTVVYTTTCVGCVWTQVVY